MNLGLRDFKFTYSWRRPITNLKDLFHEIKYGFQRFWRGYDDTYLFELDTKLDDILITVLTHLRHNRHGSCILSHATQENCHEEWDKVLEKILWYLKESNEETSSIVCTYTRRMNSVNNIELEDLIKNINKYSLNKEEYEEFKQVDRYYMANRKKAYRLVAKYIGNFWD